MGSWMGGPFAGGFHASSRPPQHHTGLRWREGGREAGSGVVESWIGGQLAGGQPSAPRCLWLQPGYPSPPLSLPPVVGRHNPQPHPRSQSPRARAAELTKARAAAAARTSVMGPIHLSTDAPEAVGRCPIAEEKGICAYHGPLLLAIVPVHQSRPGPCCCPQGTSGWIRPVLLSHQFGRSVYLLHASSGFHYQLVCGPSDLPIKHKP